ncbi:hypothetical protein P170DRAFT_451657, partial [Aspergillus steynii IBT 23096]
MNLHIQLSRDKPVYSNHDVVSGQLVLCSATPLQISGVVVTLSGTATTSLKDGRLNEHHELFRRSQRVFPPAAIAQLPGHPGLTIGAGTHRFPFSIPFSQVSECYKTERGETSEVTCASMRRPRSPAVHLLRRLPPSTGTIGTSGEIQYRLDAENCAITFQPLSDPLPRQPPSKQIQSVTLDPEVLGTTQPVSFHIETRLSHGPGLLRRHPIPLQVALTRISSTPCSVRLDDFQTMLVETTQARVQEGAEHLAQVWVVQTVANLGRSMVVERGNRPVWVSSDLWSSHSLPDRATSSFETCNLRRTHRLEVRLGFRFQTSPTLPSRLVVFDFRFPIYLMSASSTQLPATKEKMDLAAHEVTLQEDVAITKGAFVGR